MKDDGLYLLSKSLIYESAPDNIHAEGEHDLEYQHSCKICSSTPVEPGYSLDLCEKCRKSLSKRKIPIFIKLMGILCLIVLIISLPKFPKAFNAAVAYEKGLKAEEVHKYYTAMKHFEKAAKTYPESEELLTELFYSSYQNRNLALTDKVLKKLQGPSPETKEFKKTLLVKINFVIDRLNLYYTSNASTDKILKIKNEKTMIKRLESLVKKNRYDLYSACVLANEYNETNNLHSADKLLSRITPNYPDFYDALILHSTVLRKLGKYAASEKLLKSVLANNSEDIEALLAMARLQLMIKKNVSGLEYAKQAISLDNTNPESFAVLSLAYHYNNNPAKRDEMFKHYKLLKNKDYYTEAFLTAVYQGKIKWQKN